MVAFFAAPFDLRIKKLSDGSAIVRFGFWIAKWRTQVSPHLFLREFVKRVPNNTFLEVFFFRFRNGVESQLTPAPSSWEKRFVRLVEKNFSNFSKVLQNPFWKLCREGRLELELELEQWPKKISVANRSAYEVRLLCLMNFVMRPVSKSWWKEGSKPLISLIRLSKESSIPSEPRTVVGVDSDLVSKAEVKSNYKANLKSMSKSESESAASLPLEPLEPLEPKAKRLNSKSKSKLKLPTHRDRTRKQSYGHNDKLRKTSILSFRSRLRCEAYVKRKLQLSGNIETNPGPRTEERSQQQQPSESQLQVTTYNVRGLGEEKKLRHLVNALYKTKMNKNSDYVFCLQETYVDNHGKIPYLWRGNYHLTPGTGSSLGCITLLSPHLNIVEAVDVEGRAHVLAVQRSTDNQVSYILANIYAPNLNNSTKLEFFDKVFEQVCETAEKFNCETTLVLGDFNLVFHEDETKNRSYSNQEKRIANYVKDFSHSIGLADVWRSRSIKAQYTWRRPNTDCFSTIDRILFSSNSLDLVTANPNWSYSFSDHAAVKACFNMKNVKSAARSRITRLDPSLAKSDKYGAIIIREYTALIEDMPDHWNPHQKLEFAKVCIRTVVEKVQSDRKRQEATEEEALNEELDIAIDKLARGDAVRPNLLIEHIEELRARKSVLIEEKGARLAVKLGTKWYNEGEKSSRYFMRLLNRSCPDKFEAIIKEDGTLITDESLIESEIVNFYKKLYEEKKDVNNQDAFFFTQIDPIAEEDNASVAEVVTEAALRETLHTCKDSSPGPDGIPYSYLGLLWPSYGKLLRDAWTYSLAINDLPPSHKTSYLRLIPKAGKDLKKLTNWRPITLSNCDHKLITKTYARKLCEKLAPKIGERQTAYLKGRLINDNIRSLIASIELLNTDEGTGLITSLDAKKAFDSVDHGYIEQCLVKFGCSRFVPIFRTLYKNLNTDIIINGRITRGFNINRGVKQGDALSCILFIMCIEPLLRNIEANNDIGPVNSQSLGCELPKVYAYADDVNCITDDSVTSLQNVFVEYERLTRISGLELNAEKTEIMKIGTEVEGDFNIRYLGSFYTLTTKEQIKVNGILLQRQKEARIQSNVDAVVRKMDSHFRHWSRRGLSLIGKILIAKTFGISQLVYLLQSMSLKDVHFKQINSLLYKFLWNRHYLAAKAPDRIKRTILNMPISLGGLGMLDIVELDASLKLRAVGRILNSAHPFNILINERLMLSSFFNPSSNTACDSVIEEGIEILKGDREKLWADRSRDNDRKLLAAVRETNLKELVCNRGQGSLAFFLPWTRGARKIKDLRLPELDRLRRHIKADWLPKIRLALDYNLPAPEEEFYKMYPTTNSYKPLFKLSSKEIRLSRTKKIPLRSFKIGMELSNSESLTWCHRISKLTSTGHKNTILRIAHGEIYTREKLFRFGLEDNDKCPRCDETETLKHKIMDCAYVTRIWDQVDIISERLGSQVDPNTDRLTKVLGAGNGDNLTTLTLRAEIMKMILYLKPDQNYLVHPKQLVINCVKSLIIKEGKTEIKESFIEALNRTE